MSEMTNENESNNGVNEAGAYKEFFSPGRCPVVTMHGPGRHQATIRKKWSTQDYICVMKCYYQNAATCFLERKRVVSSRRAKVV